MIFYLVLGYILVAELVILGSVVGAWLSNACPQIQAIKEAYRWQHVLFYFGITALTAPFVFPLLLPRMVTAWKQESAVILAENEYWNGVRHEFKPLSLEPLHSGNVDAELREHFEHHSKVLETLGYLRYEVARFAEVAHEIDGKTDVPDEIIFPEANTIQKETLNVSVSV